MIRPILFFDIGNTLGVPQIDGDTIKSIKVFPFVLQILEKLQPQCRMGILSNTGNETLATMQNLLMKAGLAQFFEAALQLFSSVEGIDKTKIEFFRLAVERSGASASRCVYVSEDETERTMARNAGMQVSFHPLHVFHVIHSIGVPE